MGKGKNYKEGNPPKFKDKSIIQKKKNFKNTAALLNNNIPNNSDGLGSFTSSGSSTRSLSKHQKCSTSHHKSRSLKYNKKSGPLKTPENVNEIPTSSTSEDAMEWEPITEKEIIDTLHEIRRDFSTKTTFHPIASSTEKFKSISSAALHVVIDTNIFLSHLPIVQMLVEKEEFCSKVQILVPWMVLQELDFMKTNRENKVKLEILARKAGTFIFEQISKKNVFFRTQTLEEFKSCMNLLPDENADDKILQWCLNLKKEIGSDITLLSNDILFCAKASANGIQPFQSENFIQQLPLYIVQKPPCVSALNPNSCMKDLKPIPETFSSKTPSTPNHRAHQERLKEKEFICATTFLQQFEEFIVDSFSQIIEFEMKHVYEDIWLQIIIVKPPWKLQDIFRCVEKHWIAVFGYVYPRDMREKMDHFCNLWKRLKAQNVLDYKDRNTIAHSGVCILQLIQRTRKQFYYTLEKAVEGIKNLINQSVDLDDVFILDLFTRLWDRFNFICGTLADAVGLPQHGLQYIPGASIPSLQEATNGFRMLMPLLCSMESAMSRFFQNINVSFIAEENSSLEISNCLLLSTSELGLELRRTTTPNSLSRALTRFASNAQHREKMEIGLEQLRVYIQVLHSVSFKFQ